MHGDAAPERRGGHGVAAQADVQVDVREGGGGLGGGGEERLLVPGQVRPGGDEDGGPSGRELRRRRRGGRGVEDRADVAHRGRQRAGEL
ncbi:hypothetical protein, partial [Mycobacterium deserti]